MIGERVKRKGLVLVEFNQQHRTFVVQQHRLGLVEKPPVFETGNEVFDAFALDADVRGQNIVANGEHAGDDKHRAGVQERGEGGAEFADIDNDAGGFGSGG